MEGSDAILPCSLSTKENIVFKLFDWKKDGQKEVFMYDAGIHYNNGRDGQDRQFKGRVFHFKDELQHGIASIIIRKTKVADSGDYTCDFPRLQLSQTFHIQLVVERVKVVVKEDSDAVLPCSLNTKENIESMLFDWKKDGQKEVFMYNNGTHYNNKPSDAQDRQFKGRVFHFKDELKHGNASIIIRNTKVADSGIYTCIFPKLQPSQTFLIELFVGAAAKPSVSIIDQTNDWSLLQCVVRGAFPKPEVKWKNSSGNIVPAEEPKVRERGGSYDIILQTTVTKTDNFSCVATQKKINHQIDSKIFVRFCGTTSKPSITILKRDNEVLLQCEVFSVSPKTKVEWKDSSGNIVPAEEPKITEGGGSYDIILQTAVTKTDRYRCVVTQKEIDHQTENDISVTVEETSNKMGIGVVIGIVVGVILTLAAVGIFFIFHKRSKKASSGNRKRPAVKTPESETSQLNYSEDESELSD